MMSNSYHPVALVTGSAKRLGAAMSQHLHQKDYRVIIHYRHSANEAQQLSEKLNHIRPQSAVVLQANLRDQNACEQLITQAGQIWQGLDVLVNNASDYFPTPVGETQATDWDLLVQSNLMAPFFLAQAAAPYLKKQHGIIVNMSDINASRPKKNYSVFCAAKAGLNMLTKSLALELAPHIRVNGIALSTTLWAEGKRAPSNKQKQAVIQQSCLNRKAEPADIMSALDFLLSNSFVTGQTIVVDGGTGLNPPA